MEKTKLIILLLFIVPVFVLIALQAQADKIVKPKVAEKKATPGQLKDNPKPQQQPADQIRPPEAGITATPRYFPAFTTNSFELVTGVVNEFGQACESSNFKVRISSGGQPTPPGESGSTNFGIRHGYAHSAAVLHGDANADGTISAGDIVYLLNYLYFGGPPPCPYEAGDANCDGVVTGADITYLQNYLYRGGPPPCDPPA